ncbi:MAG: acyltransferase family protein [Acetobacteraceae bacterium]
MVARQAESDSVVRENIPALTAARGLAAWWVVLFHFDGYFPSSLSFLVPFARYGYLAVDFFFVLSGFIIAHNYLHLFERPTRAGFGHFLGVRLARIYPLHIFILFLYLINPIAIMLFATGPLDMQRYDPAYFLMSIVLIQNWGLTDQLAWNVPAWSISTEWLAYLFFPLMTMTVHRVIIRPWHALLGVVMALGLLAGWLGYHGSDLGGDIPFTGAPRCLTEFFAGICVYRCWTAWRHSRTAHWIATAVAVLCVGIFVAFDVHDYLVIPLAWACLVFGLGHSASPLSWLLSGAVLEAVGLYSYSTYMAHYLIRDWVKFLLVRPAVPREIAFATFILCTAIASVVLYHLIEKTQRRTFRTLLAKYAAR